MNFLKLNTFNDSVERAFEALCNQLFERWLKFEYPQQVGYFTTVNGSGGDGGVEAYAILKNNEIVGIQAKWFPTSLNDNQITQIKNSIITARDVRPNLKRYIVCVPRDFQSTKIGKGKKIVKNTEENRVNDLIKNINIKYNDLKVEFWNEGTLRNELQRAGNEGILRFWFSKEEVSYEILRSRFALAKAGWLQERYTPDLHAKGLIQKRIEELLYTPNYREKLTIKINNILSVISKAVSIIDQFILHIERPNDLISNLNDTKTYLQAYKSLYEQNLFLIKKGSISLNNIIEKNQPGAFLDYDIENIKLPNTFINIKQDFINIIRKVKKINLKKTLKDLINVSEPHNYIALGRPGTGKTHALVNAVEEQLKLEQPAFVIAAKYTTANNWTTILHETLGGLQQWSDMEIFSGLEALAVRRDIYRALSHNQTQETDAEPTRVLICVDGIDEATDIKKWKTRIDEARQWINDFPRLRFVVTSRSYLPYNENPCGLTLDEINRKLNLPEEGDYPIGELVPQYLNYYKIKYDYTPWIVNAFESAFSLKLFCEEYKGQDLASLTKPVTISTRTLVKNKIKKLEAEFVEINNPGWTDADQTFNKVLSILSEIIQTDESIEHEKLCNYITQNLNGLVDRRLSSQLLEIFTHHGILLKSQVFNEDEVFLDSTVYTSTFQSYLDYFIAIKASIEIVKSNSKNLPLTLINRRDDNVITLTAIILINDHDILVGENGYWVNDFNPHHLKRIKYEALNSTADDVFIQYLTHIKNEFSASEEGRNFMLENIILPNLNRTSLQIVLKCAHSTLIGFNDTYERDKFWSGPAKYSNNTLENVGSILSNYNIETYHLHDQIPLVFAWSLSSVNNVYRDYARKELARWASNNVNEFIHLLDLVFFCGDPQIQEDLACIMLGVATVLKESNKGIKKLAVWVNQNIFQSTKIVHIKNAVVRQGARAVIKRAFSLKECSKSDFEKTIPPYVTSGQLLPLDFSGKREHDGERHPIVHDLGWYVIKESYKGFLDYVRGSETRMEGENLLRQYKDKYNLNFGPNEFAIAAAIAFIKSLGYNESESAGFTEASHGSKSKLATFEEKYTWLAVHEIMGYLADEIPYKYNQQLEWVKEYSLMLSIPNPAFEPKDNLNKHSIAFSRWWYIPEEISPFLQSNNSSLREDVKNWVYRKDEPDFTKWIFANKLPFSNYSVPDKDWVLLHINTELVDPNNIGYTSLEIVCAFIKNDSFTSFKDVFSAPNKTLETWKSWAFHNPKDFFASSKGSVYSSVDNVLWMNDVEEEYNEVRLVASSGRKIRVHKTVLGITEDKVEGEKRFKLPSKFVRKLLAIKSGNKSQFFNKKGELVGMYNKIDKEKIGSQEALFVEKDKLFCSFNYKSFWFAFQYQSTSLDFKNRNSNIFYQNCRLWVVWFENDELQSYLIHDADFLP